MYKELEDAIYGQRLLVFLEDEPQSNKYRQVLLNQGQLKSVSDAICKILSKDEEGYEKVEVQESDELYTLPDLRDISL